MLRPLVLILIVILSTMAVSAHAQAQANTPFRSDRIVVEVRGEGPDIILIPGLASTSEVWSRAANRLDDRYRLHLVTVRGFGTVPAGANRDGALVGPIAAEVRRYIASQRLQTPAIIGHSMGGLVALRTAADAGRDRRGPQVGRVMVVDATPFFPSLISPNATVGDVEPLAGIAYQALLFLGDGALRTQGNELGDRLGGAADSVFGTLGWQGGDRQVLAQGLYEVMTTDLRSRLRDIAVPVTVVYGWSADDASPRAHLDSLFAAGYRNLRRPATFERIEGAEHMVMIDRPIQFLAAVNRFLG